MKSSQSLNHQATVNVIVVDPLMQVGELSRDDAWDFDLQKYGQMAPKTLRDGDYLATTCVYDSTERDDYTTGGLGSYDEMCINYLFCGYPSKQAK